MKGLKVLSYSLINLAFWYVFSVACCAAGIFALLLLPILAKNTYISENALMPG